jgi:methionyl-tRNA synthetase
MSNKDPFYITTAIAYANGAPHIGHAFEFVTADVHARYAKQQGRDTFFVTGMDEHGQKIEQKAKDEGIPVQELVGKYSDTFQALDRELGVEYDFFVRTSDKEKHYKGAQMLWGKLAEKGDLEKRAYEALYCVGCEEFKNEKDLNEKGECPIHLKVPEIVEEENWFFKLSNYTEAIKEKIRSDELKIYPDTRKNEIMALLERGLDDVSFSRPRSKVSWGVPVPGDDSQVMYVWCDALSNYITALGYGTENFDETMWGSAAHVIGKDILRFHAAIWPGMLLSAGLPLPRRILVHGHITSGGQKMSKSIGNVIDPQDIIELFSPATDYAGEALRFVLLHEVPSFEDGDITMESIKSVYMSYLVNGIGNMTSRIMKLATTYNVTASGEGEILLPDLVQFNAKGALNSLTTSCGQLDKKIQETEPFKVVKVDEVKGKEIIKECLEELNAIAKALQVFMPQTSAKILECMRENKMPEKPLFARLPQP